jgi:hypothetical protein
MYALGESEKDFFLIPLKLLGRRDTSGTLRDDASARKAVQHHSLHMSASLRPPTYLLYVCMYLHTRPSGKSITIIRIHYLASTFLTPTISLPGRDIWGPKRLLNARSLDTA